MITKWQVSNFKSIREPIELDFRPLTIFAGANSSGKSTLIQSILLVAQTLANKITSRPIILNGDLMSLGQLNDLKSYGGKSEKVTIKYTCEPPPDELGRPPGGRERAHYILRRPRPLKQITSEISFDAGPSDSKQRELFQIQPRLLATHLSCKYGGRSEVNTHISIWNSSAGTSGAEKGKRVGNEETQTSPIYAVKLDKASIKDIKQDFQSAEIAECGLRHFLPYWITCEVDKIREEADAITSALKTGHFFELSSPRVGKVISSGLSNWQLQSSKLLITGGIGSVLRDILKDKIDFEAVLEYMCIPPSEYKPDQITIEDWHDELMLESPEEYRTVRKVLSNSPDLSERVYKAWKEETTARDKERVSLLLPWVDTTAGYLDKFFTSSLKYLGPLRDEPKPLYPLALVLDPNDIGRRGEHTASVLELHKSKKVTYIPSKNFASSKIKSRKVRTSLDEAVADWLQYLDIAKSVESRDRGKLGHELKVGIQDLEHAHDLTHVGVGVSQVLPILVMCLLADADATLIIEQPELHLHPKVQVLLGDFFLSIALSNKQCIVETHSEYLIERLRLRIAQASSKDKLGDKAKVYFVEKPGQSSKFREIEINEYGAISNWPEGFFDQSYKQAEEILHAAAKKRRDQRDKDNARPD